MRQSIGKSGRVSPSKTAAGRSHWTRWLGKHFYLTSNLASVVDSETGQQLNPTALYLTMFFEWTGWDHERKDSLLLSKDWGSQYFYLHQADRWDKTPLLRVDFPELKQMIGMPEHVKYVAPAILATASIVDPRTQKSTPFPAWGRTLLESKEAGNSLSQLEAKGLELANRLVAYQTERMGMGLGIVPSGKADDAKWLSVGELLLTKFDDFERPSGTLSSCAEFALAGPRGISQW